jgi:hypothetical protein
MKKQSALQLCIALACITNSLLRAADDADDIKPQTLIKLKNERLTMDNDLDYIKRTQYANNAELVQYLYNVRNSSENPEDVDEQIKKLQKKNTKIALWFAIHKIKPTLPYELDSLYEAYKDYEPVREMDKI